MPLTRAAHGPVQQALVGIALLTPGFVYLLLA